MPYEPDCELIRNVHSAYDETSHEVSPVNAAMDVSGLLHQPVGSRGGASYLTSYARHPHIRRDHVPTKVRHPDQRSSEGWRHSVRRSARRPLSHSAAITSPHTRPAGETGPSG